MKTLTAIAAALTLFAGQAFGQTLIGEWQAVKSFCEDGKELRDWSREDNRTIFDKASATQIIDMSHMDDQHKTKDCALHIKSNYTITQNQFKLGPFLEIFSPKCLKFSKELQYFVKYSIGTLKENYDLGEGAIFMIKYLQEIKEGRAPPKSFKVSDDNQQLWIFRPAGEVTECPGARYGLQYKRVR